MENQLNIFAVEKKNSYNPEKSSDIECLFGDKKVEQTQSWSVFVDGAARGNPGPAGCGIYVVQDKAQEDIIKKGFYLGEKTNNQAEYLALLVAVFLIKKKQTDLNLKNVTLVIHSDSELMVRQMCGFYKVKNPALQHIKSLIEELLSGSTYKFIHIMREKNKIADKLANLGVDKNVQLPKEFLVFVADFKDIVEIIKN